MSAVRALFRAPLVSRSIENELKPQAEHWRNGLAEVRLGTEKSKGRVSCFHAAMIVRRSTHARTKPYNRVDLRGMVWMK